MSDKEERGAQSQMLGVLGRSRNIALVAGLVFLGLGIVFAFRPTGTIKFFAVLVAIAVLCVGFMEIADALADRGSPHWGWRLLRGVIHYVVGGVLIFWPDVTALVIAILIGVDLILDGVLAFVVRSRMPDDWPGRGGLLFRGGVEVILGIVVLVWPGQTLVVITYLLAAYLIILGLVLFWGAKRLSDVKKREAAGAA